MKIENEMKQLIKHCIVGIFIMVIVSSCDKLFGGKEEVLLESSRRDTTTIVDLPDSVKQHLIAQDSLYQGLVDQIDSLTKNLNLANEQVSSLDESLKRIEKPARKWKTLTIVASILGVLSFVVSVFLCFAKTNRKEAEEVACEYLGKSDRFKKLQTTVNDLEKQVGKVYITTNNPQQSSSDFSKYFKLDNRIENLEKKVEAIVNSNPPSPSPASLPPSIYSSRSDNKRSSSSRICYAKSNNKNFFTEILNSKQEGCVFVIELKNEEQGEFDLISLDKIQSITDWRDVVEVSGDCTMEEATKYDTKEKGRCEKVNDTTWEVNKPLKIKISK